MKFIVKFLFCSILLITCKENTNNKANLNDLSLPDIELKNYNLNNYHGDAYAIFNTRHGTVRTSEIIIVPILNNLIPTHNYDNIYQIGDSNFLNLKIGNKFINQLMVAKPEIVKNFYLCVLSDTMYIKKIYIDYQGYQIHGRWAKDCPISFMAQSGDSAKLNEITIYE
ncbi:MAG: hypothetical protein IPN09_05905 [Bacteroidetes bacterium]|nr:hypothetical protein [Bacteroidota bacterium]